MSQSLFAVLFFVRVQRFDDSIGEGHQHIPGPQIDGGFLVTVLREEPDDRPSRGQLLDGTLGGRGIPQQVRRIVPRIDIAKPPALLFDLRVRRSYSTRSGQEEEETWPGSATCAPKMDTKRLPSGQGIGLSSTPSTMV
jgi:hypothetical protein